MKCDFTVWLPIKICAFISFSSHVSISIALNFYPYVLFFLSFLITLYFCCGLSSLFCFVLFIYLLSCSQVKSALFFFFLICSTHHTQELSYLDWNPTHLHRASYNSCFCNNVPRQLWEMWTTELSKLSELFPRQIACRDNSEGSNEKTNPGGPLWKWQSKNSKNYPLHKNWKNRQK